MNSCLQKIIVLILTLSTVLFSTSVMAAAVHDINKTSHNFKATGTAIVNTALDAEVIQVCVYCHTPHSASKAGPLWNKAGANFAGGQTFMLYTSSATLSSATKASTLPAGSPSLLCLSCHDGKTAMNILHNSSYGVDISVSAVSNKSEYPAGSRVISVQSGAPVNDAFLMPGPRWSAELNDGDGGMTKDMRTGFNDSLTDDHPIGFSYTAAQGEKPTKLNSIATMDSAIRFFGPQKRMECSTCHNPHVDSSVDVNYKPFLAKSNANSELCLACHNK